MKTCSKCGIELSFDNFHKNKGNKDGLSGACKGCANERSKAWGEANTERVKANNKKWCEANLEKRKAASISRYEKNSERIIAASIIWRKAHTEKANAASKKWREANLGNHRQTEQRRSAKKRSLLSTLTVTQWEDIKQHFNHACCYCGEEKPLHQEHFLALSKGGEYTHNNIVPACKGCNTSKSAKDFFDWYPRFKHYSKKREQKILRFLNYSNNIQQLALL